MWTVSWWRDLLGEEARSAAARQGLGVERYLDLEAEKVPPGSKGLMVILDWLAPTEARSRRARSSASTCATIASTSIGRYSRELR